MVSEIQHLRLRFLENAACQYAAQDATTAAYLIQQRNVEAEKYNVVLKESLGSPSCSSCGSILLPGQSSHRSVTTRSPGSKRRRRVNNSGVSSTENHQKYLKIECKRCYRFVKHSLQAKDSSKGRAGPTGGAPNGEKPPVTAVAQKQAPVAKNASSKGRAKARKAGLQDMLEESERRDRYSGGSSLDLMDLMKKG